MPKIKAIYYQFIFSLSFILLIGLGVYLYKNGKTLTNLTKIDFSYFISILILQIIHNIFLGLTHKLPIEKHSIKLKLKEWLGLSFTSEMFNLLLPAKGGTALRMFYLKDKKNLSMRYFLSMGFAIVLTSFTILGIFGSIYCHYYLKKSQMVYSILESIFLAMSFTGIILVLLFESVTNVFKIKRKIRPQFYLSDKLLILKCTVLYFGMFLIYPLKVYLTFKALGVEIHFRDSFEIGLILLVSSLFQVVPGNLVENITQNQPLKYRCN